VGPSADLNLGITFVNGKAMNPVEIGTTRVATDTVDYVVNDQSGLAATSTRTVIIEPAANTVVASPTSPTSPSSGAASTTATSTAQ
jgi:hypothetical protein